MYYKLINISSEEEKKVMEYLRGWTGRELMPEVIKIYRQILSARSDVDKEANRRLGKEGFDPYSADKALQEYLGIWQH